ncbi:MAG: transcriptional regulator, AraC family [bacterium P3]|nr:MAG: transcriptional regulator, AraC family [bacterium P3]KWW34145.1 MAG: transcriptional regulator, AraC family [bacterium F083]
MQGNDDYRMVELHTVNNRGVKIIEKKFSLIMDNACAAFAKNTFFDASQLSSEHRIMLVKKGSAKYTLNDMDFHTFEGELLMVPANYIIHVNGHSHDFNARLLSFRFSDMADAGVVGYYVVKLRLGYAEHQVFESFFQMMDLVLRSPTADKCDFQYLVLSMLFRIRDLNAAYNGQQVPAVCNRRGLVFTQFMKLISSSDPIPRSVTAYADRLCVTSNYLSVCVKEYSGRTVMEWVNLKTLSQIKTLLLNPKNFTVNEIAEQLDFSSATQMIRLFKKLSNGFTPLEYRKVKMK